MQQRQALPHNGSEVVVIVVDGRQGSAEADGRGNLLDRGFVEEHINGVTETSMTRDEMGLLPTN